MTTFLRGPGLRFWDRLVSESRFQLTLLLIMANAIPKYSYILCIEPHSNPSIRWCLPLMSQYNIYSMLILLPVPQSVPKHLRTHIEWTQDMPNVDLTDARHRHTSELPSKFPDPHYLFTTTPTLTPTILPNMAILRLASIIHNWEHYVMCTRTGEWWYSCMSLTATKGTWTCTCIP